MNLSSTTARTPANLRTSIRVLLASAALAAPAAFADIGWSVDAGVGHTDNATLTDANTVSDTLPSVGGSFVYDEQTRRLQAAVDASGLYVHYVDGTFDDDFLGRASGSLVFGMVPDSFLWTVEDSYGQMTIDQFQPATPDNRQNVNVFSTGPDLIVRLGGQSDLRLSGRYGHSRFEDSDQVDSQTLQGSLAFERTLSPNSSWGVVASTRRIEYDVPGDPSYDQPELYATWHSTGARQSLSIDAGINRVEGESDSFTNPLLRLQWQRRMNPSWTLDVDLGSEYQNTSQQFANRNQNADPRASAIGISDVPAAAYYGGASVTFQRPRTRFNAGVSYTKLDYVIDNGLNEDSWSATTGISRRFTPRLQGLLNYRLDKREFVADSDLDDTKQSAEAQLDWRAGKATFLTLGYLYSDSDSNPLNTYTSNLIYLTVSYRGGSISEPRGFLR